MADDTLDDAPADGDAPVQHIFLFRCRDCDRVAEEGRWILHDNSPSVRATHIQSYPSPECPSCGSRDIDMDHGVKYIAEDDPEPTPYTKPHDHEDEDLPDAAQS